MRIVNQGNGRVLDVAGGDVRLWDADPTRRQQFALRPAGPVLLPARQRRQHLALPTAPGSATPQSPRRKATVSWRPTAGSSALATEPAGRCCPWPTARSA